jgi:DNA-directed RNA polymerase II subunit RPB2
VDGTPFNNYNVRALSGMLEKMGYGNMGRETMYCGMTGRKMDTQVFIGPTYYMRLKHMVQDKVHSRSRGPKQALTRQALEGRSKDGGLKIGTMETDAIVAHGMSQFLKERMMETADLYVAYVCDSCGLLAQKVIDKNYHSCKSCKNYSKISKVNMPYAFKLMTQELMSVNIAPRIVTNKNIYGDSL